MGCYVAGVVSAALGEAAPSGAWPARTHSQVCVSRRAMACDFTVMFPAEYRQAVDAGCAALDEIERLEQKLTVYGGDSEVSRLNQQACERAVAVDDELFSLLQTAARLSEETGGAFDVAAGALIKAWGFFRGPKRVPPEAERREALARSGMKHVELDAEARRVRYHRPGLEINLGAIGKGYAIDRALGLVRATMNTGCVLMHGGQSSLKGLGSPPREPRGWKVQIGDPFAPGRAVASIWLRNRALGTSGSAHQFFMEGGRRYGHVLDPRTGWPASGLAGASVVAPTAAEADALSTAFLVLGVEPARRYCRKRPEVGAVLVTEPRAGGEPEIIIMGLSPEQVELRAPATNVGSWSTRWPRPGPGCEDRPNPSQE